MYQQSHGLINDSVDRRDIFHHKRICLYSILYIHLIFIFLWAELIYIKF